MQFLQSGYKKRREFIKTCLRFGVGGGLVFVGTVLGIRKKIGLRENDPCSINPKCQNCSRYSGCILPQARREKENAGLEGGTRGGK